MAIGQSWLGVGVGGIAWRHAKPIIIESNYGSEFSVHQAERIENDPPRHDGADGLHIHLPELGPGCRYDQRVGPLATLHRAGALFEFGMGSHFHDRIIRLLAAVRKTRDEGERRGVFD